MIYKMNSYRNRIPNLGTYSDLKIDLGSGRYPKEGFIRMDFDPEGTDIIWDITNGIPLPDGSVGELFTSHFLEHLNMTDLHYVLMEMFRVCQNGATIEIKVPHGDTPEGHLPGHYSRLTEATMKALHQWFPHPGSAHASNSYWDLQEIRREDYHLIGIFKIIKG
jgi:hypothetical protein